MRCAFCHQELELKGRVMRGDTCPHCRRDLHCCRQCRFYDPAYHNQCREPKTEMVRDREKANLCDYFEFKGGGATLGESEAEKAKKKLEELFRKK